MRKTDPRHRVLEECSHTLPLTLDEIAEASAQPRAVVRRVLAAAVRDGTLEQRGTWYRITNAVEWPRRRSESDVENVLAAARVWNADHPEPSRATPAVESAPVVVDEPGQPGGAASRPSRVRVRVVCVPVLDVQPDPARPERVAAAPQPEPTARKPDPAFDGAPVLPRLAWW